MSETSANPARPKHALRLAGRIAHVFIQSKLTPLAIVGALLLGAFSILQTPREEEPQIVVPMLDVFVQMPGASAEEVTQRATVPMEKLLREIPGVEYVYSISHPGLSMVIVRFYVGTKEEDAIVKTYNKLYSNFDRIPQGVSQPIIKVALDRRCAHPRPDALGQKLRRLPIAAHRGGTRSFAEATRTTFPKPTIIGGQTAQSARGARHAAPRRLRADSRRGCAINSAPRTRAARPAALRATTRNFRSKRAISSRARKICNKSLWEFTPGGPCICATSSDKIEDGPAEPDNYVLFANADRHNRTARPMPNTPP